ncbi:hypothetical protein chiPu_0031665 [Chiloscyllium punctatum]|uniref:Uncharacterized protein n=1 Tax=Chiloscyllium punctatum TaxID=137246 RepID=A0A401TXP9_CHIPU|nr:hypothetical protein [Chiloscyllium punctatum]
MVSTSGRPCHQRCTGTCSALIHRTRDPPPSTAGGESRKCRQLTRAEGSARFLPCQRPGRGGDDSPPRTCEAPADRDCPMVREREREALRHKWRMVAQARHAHRSPAAEWHGLQWGWRPTPLLNSAAPSRTS